MCDNPDGARLLRSTNWIFKCSSRSSSNSGGGGGACPFVPVGTQCIRKASPSASATRQPLNLAPCLAAFSYLPQNGIFKYNSL